MKRPVIDYDECIGCGSCAELCPEVFELRDDAKAYVVAEDRCDTCDCEEAVNICPVEAISFSEE
jgi:ferredoxin